MSGDTINLDFVKALIEGFKKQLPLHIRYIHARNFQLIHFDILYSYFLFFFLQVRKSDSLANHSHSGVSADACRYSRRRWEVCYGVRRYPRAGEIHCLTLCVLFSLKLIQCQYVPCSSTTCVIFLIKKVFPVKRSNTCSTATSLTGVPFQQKPFSPCLHSSAHVLYVSMN